MIREVGIFDLENKFIVIFKYLEIYKLIVDFGSVKDLIIRIILVVFNILSVNLKVDLIVILVILKDI